MKKPKVVTRIPPSPTGRLHIGTARTALFNYLFARQHGGSVVLRSEDTDRARSKKEFEDEIIEGLTWLGLSWDSFTRQSEHGARYRELLQNIVASGKAYVSREPSHDDPGKQVEVVRLKNPGAEVVFNDLIRGDINFHTGELGDFVIARSIDDPLYHFAVVADDMDAGVTHIIRGEDHISNTARQILIQEALGASRPFYAHLPLILDEKRAKLSKRSGATSIMDYQAEGFLPEALVNYLALLGWNPGDDREYFSLDELVSTFSLQRVQKSGAVWNREKLLSVNQHWMRSLSDDEFLARGAFDKEDLDLRKVVPLLKERARTFSEAKIMLAEELRCVFTAPEPSLSGLTAKEPSGERAAAARHLEHLAELAADFAESVTADDAKSHLMPYANENPKERGGRGAVLWPLRYALSGAEKSPDPFTLIALLGRDESLSRIKHAIAILAR